METKPLNDDECLELMFLYRVVRNEQHTPDELKRLKELMRRQEATKGPAFVAAKEKSC